MKTFLVGVKEVHTLYLEVEASSEQEARDKAQTMLIEDDGDYDDSLTYDYTMEPEYWTVSK